LGCQTAVGILSHRGAQNCAVPARYTRQRGKLTDDDLKVIEGNRDQLAGKIQERYGIAREEAEKQVKEWQRTHAA